MLSRRGFSVGIAAAALGGPLRADSLRPFSPPVAAPALDLPTLAGGRIDLGAQKGKPVVIAFWATWCPPCRAELPALARLQADLLTHDFPVFVVNLGESAAKIAPFLTQLGLAELDTALDPQRETSAPWRLGALPIAYLVDRSGNLAYSLLGGVDWDDPALRRRIFALKDSDPSRPDLANPGVEPVRRT